MRGREHRILRRVVVEPGQRGGTAVALPAVAADAGVQDRIRGQRGVVRGRGRVTDVASLIGRIRHVARRHRRAVPVRRGMATAAVGGQHGAGRVIGGAQLQRRTRRAHVEALALLVASDAAGRDERVLGLGHVHRPEGARRIRSRGVAGGAIGAG